MTLLVALASLLAIGIGLEKLSGFIKGESLSMQKIQPDAARSVRACNHVSRIGNLALQGFELDRICEFGWNSQIGLEPSGRKDACTCQCRLD